MPTFQITGPNGKKYRVTGDNPSGAMKALRQSLGEQQQGPQEPPQDGGGFLSTLGDVAASGASGMARGGAYLAGLPGTIGDAIDSGGEWVQRQLGLPTRSDAMAQYGLDSGNPLSGEALASGMSNMTMGATDYQPKTTPGEYARTLGEFAPGAVAFGGAGASNLIKSLLVPALSSETAGQATKGSAWEPYARIAGTLVGGAAANKFGNPVSEKLPSAAEIKASAGYDALAPAMKGAKLTKESYQDIISGLRSEADDFGLTTDLKRQFNGTLSDFAKRANNSDGASLYDLELLRRSLRNAAGNTLDKSSQALSGKLIDKLDDAVNALSDSNIAAESGGGTPVVDALKNAREVYRTGMKSQIVEDAIQRAQSAASGAENGLRVEFRKIANNPRLARNFNAAEKEAIRNVAEGNFTSNALRWLGTFGVPIDQGRSFLGSLSGGGVGAALGGAIGGPVGATVGGFALPAAGTLAKAGAMHETSKLADIAEALVKGGPSGSADYSARMAAQTVAGREAIARALLQSQIAAQAQRAKEYSQ